MRRHSVRNDVDSDGLTLVRLTRGIALLFTPRTTARCERIALRDALEAPNGVPRW
jgi:hypothetical protein